MKAEEIIKRVERLHSVRTTPMQTWDVIEKFVVPYRGRFFQPENSEGEINWRKREIYDSTAVNAVSTLAASIHGALTSPAIQWFDFRYRNDELNQNQAASQWLEDAAKIVWAALQESNFKTQMAEAYVDLCSFGTAAIVCEERKEREAFTGLDFVSVPVKQIYFEEDERGGARTFYRMLKWTASQIVAFCENAGVECPARIAEMDKSGAGIDRRHDIVFCIYPRPDKMGADVSGELAPENRPYGYRYVMKEGGEEIGKEGGYYEMPAYIVRWLTVSGSAWGHSPAHIALSDIMSVNQAMADMFERGEREIRPPGMTTQSNVIGDWSWDGDTLNTVRDPANLQFVPPEGNGAFGYQLIQDLRDRIEQTFNVDKLQLKESPAMTATEVMARVELMNRLIGPTMGRLQSDLLDPLVSRAFNILWRNGQFPEMPEAVTQAGGDLDIDYQGPMSRAQRTDEIMSADMFVQGAVAMAANTGDMSILDNVDFDAWLRETHDMRQLPAGLLKSEDDVAETREERAQQQQAQQQIAMAQEAGQAAENIGRGLTAIEGGAGAAE